MGVASLLGKAIKKGVKTADSLFDDAAVQTKKVVDGFDEAEWLKQNPRPEGGARRDSAGNKSKEYVSWANALAKAKRDAKKPGYDSLGVRIPKYENNAFDLEAWELLNPRPEGHHRSPQVINWRGSRNRAEERANRGGHDSLGVAIKEEPDWGLFNNERWVAENPMPPKSMPRERETWFGRRKRVAARANSEGYDEMGARVMPETTIRKSYSPNQIRGMRTPPWADPSDRLNVINTRKAMEVDSGVAMDADHSPPLQGDYISGLNIPRNIQIVPKDWHEGLNNRVGMGKNSLLYTPEANANMYTDHLAYITENAGDIAYRQREKAKFVKGFSEQLSHDILSPHTKVGKNARKLWGDDTQKYVDYYKKELGLLGV